MRHRIILEVLVVSTLAACSDQMSPLAPEANAPVSLSQGGAPTPIPPGPPVLEEITSAVCGFPVLIQFTGKQKLLEFANGRSIVIGPAFTVTLINENTGQTVTRSLTGAIHTSLLPSGNIEFVYTGNNGIVSDVEGIAVFISGRFTQVFAPDGALVQGLEGQGRSVAICALLVS